MAGNFCGRAHRIYAALLEDVREERRSAKSVLDGGIPVCTGSGLPSGSADGACAPARLGIFPAAGT